MCGLIEVPRCPECGAPGVASPDACKELFAEVGAREFADEAFFRVHRLTVDAYCLQHPNAYMRSSKSAAAHLAALHSPPPSLTAGADAVTSSEERFDRGG